MTADDFINVTLTREQRDDIIDSLNDRIERLTTLGDEFPEDPYFGRECNDLANIIRILVGVRKVTRQVPLIINRTESVCGGCGQSCDPAEKSHETTLGWGPDNGSVGCGATYQFTVTEYDGEWQAKGVKAMRPDLQFRGVGYLDRKGKQFHITKPAGGAS